MPHRRMQSVSGYVVSGRGKARRVVRDKHRAIERLTDQRMYPGSLNLVLTRPVRLKQSAGLRFGRGCYALWPAELAGYPVWIYRWRRAPLHVAEILATHSLRQALGVRDGDRLQLRIEHDAVARLPVADRVIHALVWKGRGSWYYRSDRYAFSWLARQLGKHATQSDSLGRRMRLRRVPRRHGKRL